MQLSHIRCGALGVGLPATQASSWSLRFQTQVFLQPEVRQRTSRSAIAPKSALQRLAHPPRRLVREAAGVGLDLLVGAPAPLLLAAVDAAVDGAVLQLAVDALALHAAQCRRLELDLGRAGQELRLLVKIGRARAAGDDAGELLVRQRGQLPLAAGAHSARRLAVGGERLQLVLGAPGPGSVAARPVAGALRVRGARELLAAGIAHRRRGISRIGRAAAAELGSFAPGDRNPGARAPRQRNTGTTWRPVDRRA